MSCRWLQVKDRSVNGSHAIAPEMSARLRFTVHQVIAYRKVQYQATGWFVRNLGVAFATSAVERTLPLDLYQVRVWRTGFQDLESSGCSTNWQFVQRNLPQALWAVRGLAPKLLQIWRSLRTVWLLFGQFELLHPMPAMMYYQSRIRQICYRCFQMWGELDT